MYIYVCVCMYVYMYMYVYVYTYVYVCVCMYVCICICTAAYVNHGKVLYINIYEKTVNIVSQTQLPQLIWHKFLKSRHTVREYAGFL